MANVETTMLRQLIFCVLLTCSGLNAQEPLIIAHRGASKEAPENTLSAFRKAIDMGANFLEMDLHLSKDAQVVVMHDPDVERCTDATGPMPVAALTVSALKRLDAGSWFSSEFKGEPVPLLREVLELDRGPTGLMLEVKPPERLRPVMVQAMAKALGGAGFEGLLRERGPTIVASMDLVFLSQLRHKNPQLLLLPVIYSDLGLATAEALGMQHLALGDRYVTPAILQRLKQKGKQVWVWTVDSPERARFLIARGVEGIITNDPRKMLTQLSAAASLE